MVDFYLVPRGMVYVIISREKATVSDSPNINQALHFQNAASSQNN